MISTTGRMPVMAAPTAIPVNPGSEIGVSRTRSGPNSSTRPVSTLKTVPASAMSSPQMNTVGSRRISSASASRTASPRVNSRVSGINVLIHLVYARIRRVDRELDRFFHLGIHLCVNLVQCRTIREFFRGQPICESLHRIPFGLPHLLFFFRAVIITLDVANVMTVEPVCVADEECRTRATPDAVHNLFRCSVNLPHVLAVDGFAGNAEACSAGHHVARESFRIVRVFVVHVVYANVDDRQLPQRRNVHDFVQQTLPFGVFA